MISARLVTALARSALLEEVRATPKPGLVDLLDCGAHRDMDACTFFRSAEAIAPYLGQMFQTAAGWDGTLPALFREIRRIGLAAETAMFRATSGVNTHRGAIFTLGLLSAGAGRCLSRTGALLADEILDLSRDLAAQPLREELEVISAKVPVTYGEQLYAATGRAGIRGEAIAGFPALRRTALPALAAGGQPDRNRQLLRVLLELMTVVEDTAVLHRAGWEGLDWMRAQALDFLRAWPVLTDPAMEALSRLNRECVARNLSPGGCADLLSGALFLEGMERLSGGRPDGP